LEGEKIDPEDGSSMVHPKLQQNGPRQQGTVPTLEKKLTSHQQ
jgi:hypothetical protein